jgi:hypothetical protein
MTSIDDLYRPPASPAPVSTRRRARVDAAGYKWTYLGLHIVGFASSWGGTALLSGKDDALWARRIGVLLGFSATIVGLSWLRLVWKSFPRGEHRAINQLGDVTADGAVGRLFIPFFNVYWMFAVHNRLCNAISASLSEHKVPIRADPGLAFAATAALFLARLSVVAREPVITLTVAGIAVILWFSYMYRCDELRRLMLLAIEAGRERES